MSSNVATFIGTCYRETMKRRPILLLSIIGLALIATLVVVVALAVNNLPGDPPVYTPPQVARGVYYNPKGWMGRVIRVRGRVTGVVYVACAGTTCKGDHTYFELAPALASGTTAIPLVAGPRNTIPLASGGADSFLAALRRIPALGSFVPEQQQMQVGVVAIYRVRLQAAPALVGGYAGVVLDGMPPQSGAGF